ncbi:MAG TPA: hypothetical protein VN811_02210 [Thermoanaerobaculia bacterium]|nr:hypothetical protein [Thermoanaerobaculia bacterium]HXT49824.1 hypothetical protein [Thermoanaerobaculia bacterium]
MKLVARLVCFTLLSLVGSSTLFAFEVYGYIGEKWNALGGPGGFLGAPLNDETGTPDGVGRYNHFQNGSIYWTPQTQAHEVHGFIRDKWASLGWERSALGYPITDELDMGDGRGRYSNFQGGTIFWSPKTGACALFGEIMKKWVGLRGSRGFLGYPLTDELVTPDGQGRYVHFEAGSIYWSPGSGAHEVHGQIREKWAALSWERGALRYPTSDEFQDGIYRRSNFQGGYIRWTEAGGAQAFISLEGDVQLNPVSQ